MRSSKTEFYWNECQHSRGVKTPNACIGAAREGKTKLEASRSKDIVSIRILTNQNRKRKATEKNPAKLSWVFGKHN